MKEENIYLEYKEQKNTNTKSIDIEKLLSQKFSCEILLITLSSGEKCVHHYHKNRKYRYYDPFTTGKSKYQDELELEFRNQIRLFQECFFHDKENGGFRYPDNLSKKNIIEDIQKWMKYAEIGGRDILYKTYQQLITLLAEEKKIVVDIVDINKNVFEDSGIIKKGILEGININEIDNFIEASINGSNLAFKVEENFMLNIEKGDNSIKAVLYQDNILEKKKKVNKVVKLAEKKEESNNSSKCC
jgi:hypothetical protein